VLQLLFKFGAGALMLNIPYHNRYNKVILKTVLGTEGFGEARGDGADW
jgi:hypothetical protein